MLQILLHSSSGNYGILRILQIILHLTYEYYGDCGYYNYTTDATGTAGTTDNQYAAERGAPGKGGPAGGT